MLDSIRTTAGTSDWLRRLHSSRGFPDTDDVTSEQVFCSLKESDPLTCTDSVLANKRPDLDKHDDSKAIQGRDSNVPPEIFHIGKFHDLSQIKKKIACREQRCPRILAASTISAGDSLPVPLTWKGKRKRIFYKCHQDMKGPDPVEEEGKGHLDLSGCSQTEVMVKKFKRENIWKVGNKIGKGIKSRDIKKCVNENSEAMLGLDDNVHVNRGESHDLSRIKSNKSSRKQWCSRTCAVSSNSDRVSSLLPLTLTWNGKRERTVKKVNQGRKVVYHVKESRDRNKGKESLNETGDVQQKKQLKRYASSFNPGCEKKKQWNVYNSPKYVAKEERTNSGRVTSLVPLTLTWKHKRERTVKKFNQDRKVADHVNPWVYLRREVTVVDNGLESRDRKKGKESLNRNADVQQKKLKPYASISRVCEEQMNWSNSSKYVDDEKKTNSDRVSSLLPLSLTWNGKRERTVNKVNHEWKGGYLQKKLKPYASISRVCDEQMNWSNSSKYVDDGKKTNSDRVSSLLPLSLTWNSKRERTVNKVNHEWKGGYLPREVTVIDKGLENRDRKKGKENLNGNGDVQKKKLMRYASSSKVCEKQRNWNVCKSSKYVDKDKKAKVRSRCTQGYDQGKTMIPAYEKKQDNCSQEKRVLKKQIDGGSSVILIKSLPTTNKKDMSGISKSCGKSAQK